MLIVDQLRGQDATGVGSLSKDGKSDWIKNSVLPEEFLNDKDVVAYFQRFHADGFAIGHNRAKTHGRNNTDNAHPFSVGNILGVHNGTIHNKYDLCDKGHSYEVDSHAFFAGVSENGIKETVKASDGAFSVAYINTEEKTINFVRNEERPMYFLEISEDGFLKADPPREHLLFGSELLMLIWVASRMGFKTGKHFETVPYKHYSFAMGQEKPVISDTEKYVKKEYHYHGGRNIQRRGSVWKDGAGANDNVLMLPSNVPTKPSVLTAPRDMSAAVFYSNKSISNDIKNAIAKLWNASPKETMISFTVHEAIDLKASMQIIGKLAGKKKENLPVIVSSIVDKDFFSTIKGSNTILQAKLTHKGVGMDGKSIEFIVKDPMILVYTSSNEEPIDATC